MKIKKSKKKFRPINLFLLSIINTFLVYTANAQTVWTGGSGVDLNWSTSSNWSPSVVPTSSTDVDIQNTYGNDPILDATGLKCKNLQIEAGGALNGASSTDLTVSGNVYDDGDIFAYGTIFYISGDISVGNFTEGSSTVVLNGANSTNQNINGYYFYNLIINNTGGGIAFGGDAVVTNALTMTKGNITTTGYTLTLGTTSANIGTLAWTAGYMTGTGTFQRWFNTSAVSLGAVAGLFPMGVSTLNRSCWIGGTPGTAGTISVAYTQANTVTSFVSSYSENSTTMTHRNDAAWAFSTANSFAGTGLSLRIQASGMPGVSAYAALTMSGASGAAPGSYSAPSGPNSDPQVNRTGLTASNLSQSFFIADNGTNALPVTLIDFEAFGQNGIVNLSWQTASEINNNYFDVERSNDGNAWQTIGNVAGHGNSFSANNYMLLDNLTGTIPEGTFYYRLKQVDFNGAYIFSMIRPVSLSGLTESIQTFPNPTNNMLNMSWTNADNGIVTLNVTDINGKSVYTEAVSGKGLQHKQIDMTTYPAGEYLIQVVSDKSSITKTVIKK